MYEKGDKLKNIHTKVIWTVVEVEDVKHWPDDVRVWTLANSAFQDIRVNAEFLRHYKPYSQEEE